MPTTYTATLTAIELCNGIDYIQDFVQNTFAKRGLIITYFHTTIYQKMDGYRLATIKFNFYVDSYNSPHINQHRYADRILYRLQKYSIEEDAYNARDKHTRGDFKPSIEPFEIVHSTNPRESWIVKLT